MVAVALDFDVVGWAVQGLDGHLAFDTGGEFEALDGLGGELLSAKRVGQLDDVAVALQELGVGEGDLAVSAGGIGKTEVRNRPRPMYSSRAGSFLERTMFS